MAAERSQSPRSTFLQSQISRDIINLRLPKEVSAKVILALEVMKLAVLSIHLEVLFK
jgi:hypothetical protein